MSHQNAWKLQMWAWGVFAVLFLAGCGLNGPAHREPLRNANAVIDMGFMSFQPAVLTVRSGATVEWRNTALIAHTVTDDPAHTHHPALTALPPGAAPFNSGKINAGAIYTHTFTVPGTYKYYCRFHADHGMAGTIVVTP